MLQIMILMLLGFVGVPTEASAQPFLDYEGTSLINLIATPERFSGKKVAVSGWLSLAPENMSLCIANAPPSRKECVWIELERPNQPRKEFEERLNQWKKYDNVVVMVHGTFEKGNKGHLDAWSGALDNIVSITPRSRK